MKSLALTGALCLSFLSWNSNAQNISFNVESQQRNQHSTLHPTVFIPLKQSYQLMGFVSLKTPHELQRIQSYQQQGYGLGISYQSNHWIQSQLLVQTNRNKPESRVNIEIGF